jgi:hypothetical protein
MVSSLDKIMLSSFKKACKFSPKKTEPGPQATMATLWANSRRDHAPDFSKLQVYPPFRLQVSRDNLFSVIKDNLIGVAVDAATGASRAPRNTGTPSFGTETGIDPRLDDPFDWTLYAPTEIQTFYNLPADQTFHSVQHEGTGDFSYQHIGSDTIYTVLESPFTKKELEWLRLNNYLP